jgi:hypothetical protein
MTGEETHVNGVAAFLCNMGDGTHRSRPQHDFVRIQKRILVYRAIDVSSRNVVTDFEVDRAKVPFDAAVESLSVDSSRNVDCLGNLVDGLERTLDSIINRLEQAWKRSIERDGIQRRLGKKKLNSPGPNSTERGFPVRNTGSPMVIPEVSSYT